MDGQEETYSITVAYNGAPFAGFAKQPGQLTVQGELDSALSTAFRQSVETVCAGRTDAGVHARMQVVSFSLPEGLLDGRTSESIVKSLNALTHDCISVRSFDRRPRGFSARFDATMREYRYFIFNEVYPPIFSSAFSWHIKKPLSVQDMQEASAYLIGEHDFKSFCLACSAEGKSTSRYVDEISFHTCQELSEPLLCITVRGNAFLHSMVRAIVGTLVAVGKGLRTPEWVQAVLDAKDRKAAGENAPASGLVLWSVEYGEDSPSFCGPHEAFPYNSVSN